MSDDLETLRCRATLKDRLRGHYRIPITDGLGATGGGEEPENPNEFVRTYKTPPIQHEAAAELDRLATENAALLDRLRVAEAVADAADLWTYCENNPDDAEDKLVAAVEQYRTTRPEARRDGR